MWEVLSLVHNNTSRIIYVKHAHLRDNETAAIVRNQDLTKCHMVNYTCVHLFFL